MSDHAALKLARKRFGPKAHVSRRKHTDDPLAKDTHSVGKIAMGMFFSVEGWGDSWEEAFNHHAKRRLREREEFIALWRKHHHEDPPANKLDGMPVPPFL